MRTLKIPRWKQKVICNKCGSKYKVSAKEIYRYCNIRRDDDDKYYIRFCCPFCETYFNVYLDALNNSTNSRVNYVENLLT